MKCEGRNAVGFAGRIVGDASHIATLDIVDHGVSKMSYVQGGLVPQSSTIAPYQPTEWTQTAQTVFVLEKGQPGIRLLTGTAANNATNVGDYIEAYAGGIDVVRYSIQAVWVGCRDLGNSSASLH